ncbi:hypothetical protein BDK51DRAFT_51391 [Blyttiomyces helicus]|uniref:Uncharacterized protein n=1 Tax=Blyttiomyces helicus TaxID=388810 RepID=A0A4P9W825_9FUNG|nr:hypothetical protein BDK51DRAFT_51391 [Blyttiomyces helicus]|eukprot:RKO86316.1 hypothetical protein BDK51DRAFT_51391 [Blyttiomyces helicus]
MAHCRLQPVFHHSSQPSHPSTELSTTPARFMMSVRRATQFKDLGNGDVLPESHPDEGGPGSAAAFDYCIQHGEGETGGAVALVGVQRFYGLKRVRGPGRFLVHGFNPLASSPPSEIDRALLSPCRWPVRSRESPNPAMHLQLHIHLHIYCLPSELAAARLGENCGLVGEEPHLVCASDTNQHQPDPLTPPVHLNALVKVSDGLQSMTESDDERGTITAERFSSGFLLYVDRTALAPQFTFGSRSWSVTAAFLRELRRARRRVRPSLRMVLHGPFNGRASFTRA